MSGSRWCSLCGSVFTGWPPLTSTDFSLGLSHHSSVLRMARWVGGVARRSSAISALLHRPQRSFRTTLTAKSRRLAQCRVRRSIVIRFVYTNLLKSQQPSPPIPAPNPSSPNPPPASASSSKACAPTKSPASRRTSSHAQAGAGGYYIRTSRGLSVLPWATRSRMRSSWGGRGVIYSLGEWRR